MAFLFFPVIVVRIGIRAALPNPPAPPGLRTRQARETRAGIPHASGIWTATSDGLREWSRGASPGKGSIHLTSVPIMYESPSPQRVSLGPDWAWADGTGAP
ncbi:hypothetical protein PCL_12600 [Purpureocillium lilacinum]|uniref:Uncharacterized protein n=1 Tax=Purpureocillium lilacinum TaxID=33203 RepID=A0A2U3E9Q8_PURLI|nr:hypothetical protein Purlil1_8722 [Purpureocillium lilacinum]PWI71232.1 hypothetical protein PCL_12600 [Purpureocillium lilacinum]